MAITTIIFDVDDCLYDVGTGFTAHRNTDGATDFMVEKLHFPSKEAAQELRDEYFLKYHSTAKGLRAAEEDGRLPKLPVGVSLQPGEKRFKPSDLDEYWATNLDFSMLGGPLDERSIETFESLSKSNTQVVGFSNGPRLYVERVLKEIGLARFFEPEKLFGVTDVLPHCKPDRSSFELVLSKVSARPEQCIMVEDSMKNIRAAKALGMKTILIMGKGRKHQSLNKNASLAEATKVGDAPDENDQAVDAAVESVAEIDTILKEWKVL